MKAKDNLWSRKRNTFLLLIIIAMIAAVGISFISFFKTDTEEQDEELTPYSSMYNASRYFFRVFYPDDWNVNADQYGFMLDNDTGLVLEAFPLKKMTLQTPIPGALSPDPSAQTPLVSNTPLSTPKSTSSASSSPDPRAGMERDNDLTMSFYYKTYEELIEFLEAGKNEDKNEAEDEQKNPEDITDQKSSDESLNTSEPSALLTQSTPALQTFTPSPFQTDGKQAPVERDTVVKEVFEGFRRLHAEDNYKFSGETIFEAEKMSFSVLTYEYIKDDLKMSGELYVATRAMAYYIIKVDGTASAFMRTQDVVHNMLYNMVFSVFDY